MTSTLVHLAFAGLIAAALLGEAFDRRSVLVVVVVTAAPDLDSFIALYTVAGHRTVLHNVWLPAVAVATLWFDTTVRDDSVLRERWGPRAVRVAWVSVLCYLFAHVGLDLVDGVVNLFWPVHDQFYRLTGSIELSGQRGVVQTFVDGDGFLLFEPAGTTREVTSRPASIPARPTVAGSQSDCFPSSEPAGNWSSCSPARP